MSEDNGIETAAQTVETPPPATQADPWSDVPVGTENLLDAQLGEALKIMRDFSLWIHAPNTHMSDCLEVSGHVSQLMLSSAKTARRDRGASRAAERGGATERGAGHPQLISRKRIGYGNVGTIARTEAQAWWTTRQSQRAEERPAHREDARSLSPLRDLPA